MNLRIYLRGVFINMYEKNNPTKINHPHYSNYPKLAHLYGTAIRIVLTYLTNNDTSCDYPSFPNESHDLELVKTYIYIYN